MLVSLFGGRWRKVWLAMFTAYLDDSGSDPKQHIANATALIIPAKKILALEREWDKLRQKHHFHSFHMAEFSTPNKKPDSEFAKWNEEESKAVFTSIRNVCKKYGVKVISFTVNKEEYDEIAPEFFRRRAGMFHYTWAVRHVLSHVMQWRLRAGIKNPLEYVFDSMGRDQKKNLSRQEIVNLMDEAEEDASEKGLAGEYANWAFGDRRCIPGLQCVDVLAWTSYQFGLQAYRNKPMVADARIAWADFIKCGDGNWLFPIVIKKEHLKKWVASEIADGRSFKRFEERDKRLASLQGGKNAKPRVREIRCDREKGILGST
jgi:hypothetical protein